MAKSKVELVAHTPNPERVIEVAASMCYDSEPTENYRILKGCYKSGHLSVFEHASFTFHITGVSRTLLAQITRHRLASFSVRSQRYCSEDGFDYVTPASIARNEKLRGFYDRLMSMDADCYAVLQKCEVPNEDARYLLPNSCETEMVVTMNARELINFCHQRLCTRAQWEIRDVAQQMVQCVKEVSPVIASYLRPQCEQYAPLCFCTEAKCCGKHPKLADVYKEEMKR